MQIGFVSQEQADNLNYPCTMVGSVGDYLTGLPQIGFGSMVLYSYMDQTRQNGAQEVFFTDGSRYWRKAVNDYVTPWYRVATATPPQEYDLPLAEGFIAQQANRYYKTQMNEVHISIAVKASSARPDGSKIATLPEGFRPANVIENAAICKNNDAVGSVQIQPNGNLIFCCLNGMASNQILFGSLDYISSSE